MNRLVLDGPGKWTVGVAVVTWLAVLAVAEPFAIGCGFLALAGAAVRWPRPAGVVAAFWILGLASGFVVSQRIAAAENAWLPTGSAVVAFQVAEDASASSFGLAVAKPTAFGSEPWDGPRVGIRDLPADHVVGSRIVADVHSSPGVRRIRDEIVAGVMSVKRIHSASDSPNPVVQAGNAVRSAVDSRYDGTRRVDGLLAGFLTGNTEHLSASDTEALRRAGLSHFVAVSGSNVALFLGMWWLVTAPLAMQRRLRVLVGVVGLALFAVVTRWEPSVVRACVMAFVVLASGSLGVPLSPWTALGVAVTLLLLVSGDLAFSLGFQLSVLATAGVLLGLGLSKDRKPRWLILPLFSTMGAQLAVAPLLLIRFGVVPLLSPLTNLVVGPVIAMTTIVAATGVAVAPLADVARLGASLVQAVADSASTGPQLGPVHLAAVGVIGAAATIPVLRAPAAAVALITVVTISGGTPWPTVATLTVLDVGQGDAVLVQTPDGGTLLMDGGSSPTVLDRALRRHGVRTVDTVVVSHGDEDHVGGLAELVSGARTARLVVSQFAPPEALVAVARANGVVVEYVSDGSRLAVGGIPIEVLSPERRYQSDNDGSVVLLVGGGVSVLLPGDIEAVAQSDLPPVTPDVLIVPHHGSATTDLRWLAETVGQVAVLSYGPNRYGHPHPDIVGLLTDLGVDIRATVDGDVVIPLVSPPDVTRGR